MKSAGTPLGHVRGRPERSLNAYRQVPKVVLFKYYSRLVLPQTRSILITVGAWTLGNQLFNSQKVAIQQLIMNSVLFKVLLDRCTQLRVHPSLQSGQLIMEQLLLKRPGVSHMTLPPQGIGGSVRFGSWVGFWALNTGF